MIKHIKTCVLCILVGLLSSFVQAQEIELVFDTSGYRTEAGNSRGIVASPNIANDTLPSIKGEANVSAMGGLNYTIPIDVLPGVNDFAPNLALVYNSQAGDGIAGYGWNISGLSSIAIGGKSKEIDGVTMGAQIRSKDNIYYLDGGRLLTEDGVNFTTLVHSKIKIEKPSPDQLYFSVKYPNGKTALYTEFDKGIALVYAISDAFGNSVSYRYDKIEGVTYLKKIEYRGKSGVKEYLIHFEYKDRKFKNIAYSQGFENQQSKILSKILVMSPEDNTKVYRTYNLSYDYIHENTVERLIQVEVINQDNQKLPPLNFNYTDKDSKAYIVKTEKTIQIPNDVKEFGSFTMGDFLGTGELMPVYEIVLPNVKGKSYREGEKNFSFWNSDLGEVGGHSSTSNDLYAGKVLFNKTIDGKVEKVMSEKDLLISLDINYKNGTVDEFTFVFRDLTKSDNKILKYVYFHLPALRIDEFYSSGFFKEEVRDKESRYIYVGDVNNDGLVDLVIFQPAGKLAPEGYYFYELGKNYEEINKFTPLPVSDSKLQPIIKEASSGPTEYLPDFDRKLKVYPIEFDGDGIPEFMTVNDRGAINILKIDPLARTIRTPSVQAFRRAGIRDFNEKTPLIFGDFNGDGLTDFMTPVNLYSLEGSSIEAVLNKMNSDRQLWWIYTSTGRDFQLNQKDFTEQNLAYIVPSQRNVIKKHNGWDKFWSGKKETYRYTEYGSSNIMAMDVNGDGKTDVISFKKYGRIKYDDKLLDAQLDNELEMKIVNGKFVVNYVSCECDNGELNFFLTKPNNTSGFDLQASTTKLDLSKHRISPLSFLYNKTDYNVLNAYKSSLVIHDPLTRREVSYTIERDDFIESQLRQIDNGSGVIQEIEYSPMSENYVSSSYYDRTNTGMQKENANSYNYTKLNVSYPYVVHKTNGSHYLVRKMHTLFEDKILTKDYHYYNAIQHLEGKGLLGFQKTKTSEVYESKLNTGRSRSSESGQSSNTGDGMSRADSSSGSDRSSYTGESSSSNDYSRDQITGSSGTRTPYPGGSTDPDNPSRGGTRTSYTKGYINKYIPKDSSRGILWNTYTYDYKMDNAIESERFGDFDETKDIRVTRYWHERKTKPNKSYLILQTNQQVVDELSGFITHQISYYNDEWLLERVVHSQWGNNNTKEEKFTYLPEFTKDHMYFYGKIGSSTTISKRDGHTFSTKEEYTYTPNGAVATVKKYGNNTNPITTSYTYYPFGGIKEEKLTYIKGSKPNLGDLVISNPGIEIPKGDIGVFDPTIPKVPGDLLPVGPKPTQQTEELTTSYEYDPSHRFIVKTTTPDGLVSTATVDGYGKILSQTNAFGQTTTFKYDSWGNAHTITNYLGKSVKTKKTKSKVEGARYDVTVTGDDGSSSITSYNLLDQPIQTKTKSISKLNFLDPVGPAVPVGPVVKELTTQNASQSTSILKDLNYWIVTRQGYDVHGNVIESSQPFLEGGTPKWNYTQYDHLNRPTEFRDFNGKITRTCYEKNKVSVEDGHKKSAKWLDADGLVIKSQDQGGTILYSYYANGSLKEADYEGIKTKISIDGWGNKTKLVDPSAGTYLYQYDNISRLIKTTNPQGGITTYTYNKFGQVTTEKTTSAAENTNIDITYTYDERSKLPLSVAGTYNGQAFAYSTVYDSNYRLKEKKEETPAFTYSTTFTYDGFDRIEKTKSKTILKSTGISSETEVQNAYKNGILYKQLDESSKMIWQLTSLTNFGGTKQVNYGNGYQSINTYNEHSYYLENIKHSKDNTAVVDIDYTYDLLRGTLLQRNNKTFAKSESFTYDNLDRLLTEKNNNVLVNEYTYDQRGRTTSNTEIGKYNYTDTDYRLQDIEMNASGAQKAAARGFATVQYNAFKSPNEIFLEGKGRINYEFSILKNRYVAYFGSTETKDKQPIKKYYSSDKTLEILLEGNKTKIITYVTGDPYSANYIKIEEYKGNVRQSNKNYYLHRDNQQSIVAITDSEGNNIEQRYFDAWGNLRAAKIAGVNKTVTAMGWTAGLLIDRGYTGHEHLYTVGLIHMNGRIYDPLLRRFLSPDNYVQQVDNTQNYNRYGYVLNNPLLYTDPSGEYFLATLGIAIVSAIIINGISNSSKNIPFFYGSGKAGTIAGITAVITFGIGSAVGTISNALVRTTVQAGAHGIVGGAVSEIEGGKFISGFAAGVVSSLVSSGIESVGPKGNKMLNASQTKAVMIAGGGLSGGISSTIAGGDFWKGMRQGLIVSGLNHSLHAMVDGLEQDIKMTSRTNRAYGYSEAEIQEIEKWLKKFPLEVEENIVKFKNIDDFSIQLGKKGEIVFISKKIDSFIKDQAIGKVQGAILERMFGKVMTGVLEAFFTDGKLGDSTNKEMNKAIRNFQINQAKDALFDYMFKPQESNIPVPYRRNIVSKWTQFYRYKIR